MTRSAVPLALDDIKIPYGQAPNPPMPTNTLGINIAAVTGFPKGLLVEIPPWDVMGKGDSVNLRLDANVVDSGAIIDDADVGKPVRLFIPAAQLLTGSYRVDYVVTRPGTPSEPSPATPIYVKIERPGGQDQNGSAPGHSELIMEIPEEFELGGVDADTPFVPITILPYPEIKEGDRIFLSWAGVYVEHPVTAEQAEDPDAHPIVITVDKATIDAGGDADELPVAFFVRDVVNNDSEDWSAEARLGVNTGNSRLLPPLIEETDNNVLDMDNLPDSDTVTAQVVAYGGDFAVGDEIGIRLKGTTVDGEAVDKTYPLVPVLQVNKIVDIPLPSADVRPLVNTQVVFSYRLVKANGTDDLFSKGLFVRVIGEAQRLKAPIAKDAIAGTLDPALLHTIIQIPWDDSMAAGQVIELQWFGTRANGSTYFPPLDPHPISNGEEQAKEPIDISVDGVHVSTLDGGTLELFYLLLRDTDARDIVRRESLHAELLNVGEPVAELPEPVVEGEQDGVLDPADKPTGTRLIVRAYDDQIAGDEVHYAWVGSKSGMKTDYLTLSSINDDDDVPFTIGFDLIKENEGGTVKASYWIRRKAGGISPSEVLSMSIGPAMDLTAPSVKEATGTAPVQQLNPVAASAALTVVIPEYGIKPDDQVSVTWTGAPGEGSYTVPAQTLPTSREISIPVSVIAYNLGKPVTVTYSVTRNGGDSPPSAPLNLAVQTIAPGDLLNSKPKISQAANEGEGTELDLNDVTGGGTVRIEGWPHIAVGQYVWLRLKGNKADGSDHDRTIWQAPSRVTQGEYDRNYLQATAPYDYLKELGDGTTLTVEFKVAFGRSTDEALADTFPLRTYTVSAIELIAPTLTDIRDAQSSVVGGITVATSVTVTGTGSSGQRIQLMDGASTIGPEITVPNDSTNWTATLTGLTAKAYSLKAKALYGTGVPDSAAKAFTVTQLLTPTLDNVKDANEVEIPEATTTVSTTLKLSGQASKGQKVEVYEGNGANAQPKGQATADTTTGVWRLTITVATGDRRLYAKSLYHSGDVYSNVRTLNVATPAIPAISSVKDSRGDEIINGSTTVTTTVSLTGTATPGLSIELFDGNTPKGTFVATNGTWTAPNIGVGPGDHSFTAKAKYGDQPVSAAHTFKVVTAAIPAITSVKDSRGDEIINGSTTVTTTVNLTGTATPGLSIELFDGNTPKGTFVATNGTWTAPNISVGPGDRSFTAKAKYGDQPVSAARTFKVVTALTPAISSVKEPEEASIPNGGITAASSVILTGSATAGFSVEILDNGNSKGTFVATGGTWTTTAISVAPDAHSFTAKAKYGSEPISGAWGFTVITLTDQHKPYIQEAENNGAGATFDMSTFTGNATVKVRPWPGIAVGQKVWLRCKGKKANGDDHLITLYTASGVIASEVTGGLSKSLSRSQLELLGGDTELTVELKVKFNGSGTEDGATVFPLRTYRVILKAPASIEVGVSPTRHALSPDGAHLYVCIFEARKIVVVSTATYTVIRTIDSPEPTLGPTDISISPDGTRAYVFLTTNFVGGPHSVRILDLTTYSFTSGGASPFATSNDIALTKDGTQLYVGNARSISIYDSTNLSQIGTVPLIGLVDNNFITFSPDGTRGYYTSALGTGPSTVDVIDTVTYSVLRSIGLPNAYAASLTLSPDGSRAYVGYNPRYAGGSNICSVSVLDTTTERIITTLNIPDMSADGHSTFRVITSLDGTRAYLYGYRYRQIGVLNTATLTLMPSIPIPAELAGNGVYHITCSPTGAYLYASMAAGSQLGIIPIRS